MPESTYKTYFLGPLAEEASAEIELRVLEDADFAAEISAVEENLIEDYLDNSLSSEDANLFRTNYLNTEERIKNVEMTALMKRFARENVNNTVEIKDSTSREEFGFFQWFNSLGLGVRLATASVALIVVVTSVWFVSRPQRDNELIALQNRYELLNQDPNSVSLDTKLSELTLVSGNLRGPDAGVTLSHADLTENVKFRIALPQNDRDESNVIFTVIVLRDTAEVFRQNNIRPRIGTGQSELRLLFPREILTNGNYRVNLQTSKASDLNYYFVVR
jgi:hypothetical protein